jgi:siroheme synthase
VAVVTGHEATKDHNRVDWSALARIETLIFLMGVNNVMMIADSLLAEGMDPGTPAAMIQMALARRARRLWNAGDDRTRGGGGGIRPPATW